MQFLSSLIRLVQFQRHLKLSRWLIRLDIQQSAHTDQVRQQIQQLQTSLLLLTLARLRQVLLPRSERVAKYNQLLRIEEQLGAGAVYPGIRAFNVNND